MLKNEKFVLLLLAALQFTNIMDFMIMMPLSVHIMPAFNITPRQFSYVVSAYAFAAFLSSLFASFFVDKFDRKKVLVTVYAGFLMGTFACSVAPSYTLLVAARILAGVFGGLIAAQVLSIVGDYVPFERRGQAMGILFTGFSFASVAGVPLGVYLADKFQWQIPFALVGFMGLIMLPLIIYLLPAMTKHLKENTSDKLNIFKVIYDDKNLQIGLLMMFTLVLSHFSTIPFLAQYIETNVGFTKSEIALVYMTGGACTLMFSPLIGKLSDKFGKFRMFTVLIFLSWVPVFLITNMTASPMYYVLTMSGLFFIFAGGRYIPAQALITSVIKPQYRGGFMNINASSQNLAVGLASLISGQIVETNAAGKLEHYNYVGYFAIVVSCICMLVARQLKVKSTI